MIVDHLGNSFTDGFRYEPIPDIQSWSAENIVISTKETQKDGPYKPELTPYLAEIAEVLHPDHPCQDISVMKGTQQAISTLAKNAVAHRMKTSPCSILYVLPSIELGRKFSKQRIKPMFEASPNLHGLLDFSKTRDADNAWNYKDYPGGVFMMGGANSAASLSQTPVIFLILDENDRFARMLPGEGDPTEIAIARLDGAGSMRKLFRISSPTQKGYSHIDSALESSDYRQYFLMCPHCGYPQTFQWDYFIIPRDEGNRFIFDESHFKCQECNGQIEEHKHKEAMISEGRWFPTRPYNINRYKRGYQINSFYSNSVFINWRQIAESWGNAIGPQGNIHKVQVFFNTKLGLPFEKKGDTVSEKHIMKHRVMHELGDTLPHDTCVLTAGVDTQDNRLEVEIVAWNQYEDSYSMDYVVIPGDPAFQATWDKLDLLLFYGINKDRKRFPHALGPTVSLPILATCIDMGGHRTQQVLNYCASRAGLNAWAINGVHGQGRPIWPRKVTTGKHKLPFYSIGVDTCKELLYARLKNETPNSGCCWFPPGRDKQYYKGLTSEAVEEKSTRTGVPKRVWSLKAGHKRNEPIDCRNYATAGLEALKLSGFVLSEAYQKIVDRAGASS